MLGLRYPIISAMLPLRKTIRMRKRVTLRKKILIGAAVLMCGTVAASYALAALHYDNTCADIAVALITVFGAAFATYLAADTADHASANKHGIDLTAIDAAELNEESDGSG